MADSAAATVSISIVKAWPTRTLKNEEPTINRREAANSISSIDIMRSMRLVLLRHMPMAPNINITKEVSIKDFILIPSPLLSTRISNPRQVYK